MCCSSDACTERVSCHRYKLTLQGRGRGRERENMDTAPSLGMLDGSFFICTPMHPSLLLSLPPPVTHSLTHSPLAVAIESNGFTESFILFWSECPEKWSVHNYIIITHIYIYMYMYIQSVVGSSLTRGSSFFLGKVTALGVLCCFALLFV